MNITPYQIVVPLLAAFAVFYAWSLAWRKKKTIWEAILWTFFWVAIAAVAAYPAMLTYLTAVTGIKDQTNAVLVTSIGILFFFVFWIIIRIEEMEQRQTRIVRAMALKEAELEQKGAKR